MFSVNEVKKAMKSTEFVKTVQSFRLCIIYKTTYISSMRLKQNIYPSSKAWLWLPIGKYYT